MRSVAGPERDLGSIRLPRWGRVQASNDVVPWLVVAEDGQAVDVIRVFLRDFIAQGNRPGSVRSYAYDLLRWWRWLRVIEVDWDKATSAEVREFVLWLIQACKPRNSARTNSELTVGTVNPITRKRYLDDRYAARTVRHSNAVLRSFYEYWIISVRARWSIPCAGIGPGGSGPTRITIRCNPSGRKAGSSTTRRSPRAGPGRCPTACGTSCSSFGVSP